MRNAYAMMDHQVKKSIMVDFRYWMMHDLFWSSKGFKKDETSVMKKNLLLSYSAEVVDRLYEAAWTGLSSTFLKTLGMEAVITRH